MPHLMLRVVEDKEMGKGYLEVLEQRCVMCKFLVGMISYDNGADKKQLIEGLLDGGKNGLLVPLSR